MRGQWLQTPTDKTVVVFVHGINSDGENAWKNENGTYWPGLLVDKQSLTAPGIYVFSYYSSFKSKSFSIDDAFSSFTGFMQSNKVIDNEKIIFCCHSQGGLIVRKYLVNQKLALLDSGKQIGLFLVASPSKGSPFAKVLSLAVDFLDHAEAKLLNPIDDNAWLLSLHTSFLKCKEEFKDYLIGQELVEGKPMVSGIFRNVVN